MKQAIILFRFFLPLKSSLPTHPAPYSFVDTFYLPTSKHQRRSKRRNNKVFLLFTLLKDPFWVYLWKDLIYVNP
ncbi:hypothetical protein CKAN_00546300 [Cinnamomum micranthum f. kanehirae]|uniref:Uncharacterized protein n=1 Tax=Cinnamomum micranthum f. kanehirae TaxID=337451 RepID=A0A3S3NCK7_9MAGN|nr:hypothetical protein CKAN_00546300 [Cinnamomum micranthum f. kanehirae]